MDHESQVAKVLAEERADDRRHAQSSNDPASASDCKVKERGEMINHASKVAY